MTDTGVVLGSRVWLRGVLGRAKTTRPYGPTTSAWMVLRALCSRWVSFAEKRPCEFIRSAMKAVAEARRSRSRTCFWLARNNVLGARVGWTPSFEVVVTTASSKETVR